MGRRLPLEKGSLTHALHVRSVLGHHFLRLEINLNGSLLKGAVKVHALLIRRDGWLAIGTLAWEIEHDAANGAIRRANVLDFGGRDLGLGLLQLKVREPLKILFGAGVEGAHVGTLNQNDEVVEFRAEELLGFGGGLCVMENLEASHR